MIHYGQRTVAALISDRHSLEGRDALTAVSNFEAAAGRRCIFHVASCDLILKPRLNHRKGSTRLSKENKVRKLSLKLPGRSVTLNR